MSTSIEETRPTTVSERLSRLFLDDHCEWANRYVYWLKTPLGVLSLSAAASLLLGVFVAPQGYALLAAIMAVIATGLVWPKLGIRGVGCNIAFPSPRAREGHATTVDVQITNRWPWPVWGLVIEDGFFDVGPDEDGSAVALARIGGWSRTTFQWEFTPELRGRYPKVNPRLVTAFPFGLWKASKEIAVEGSVVAWPKTFWLPPYPMTAAAASWSGEPCDAYAGAEGERIGVREHRHGDSLRLVHWAKTARHDRLIVSERQGASLQSASVIVDTDPRVHEGAGGDSSFEWSIRIAASVAEALLAQGVRLEMRLGDERREFGSNQADNARLMDWLAEYAPQETTDSHASSSATHRRSSSTTRLRIATNRSEPSPGETTILLDAGAFSDRDRRRELNNDTPTWIAINDPHNVADQLLQGWRRASREASRGA